jgi:cyclophilin family peptidyl-prolyl cis-trans isomerase
MEVSMRNVNKKSLILGLAITAFVLASCGRTDGGEVDLTEATPTEESVPIDVVDGPSDQWDAPPEMTIDPDAIYLATFKTERGDIVVELFADKTPVTVNNFVFLAEEGYYDGTTFHRVLADFMAQGGDPTHTGSGGPGYQFEDEFVEGLLFNEPGLLAMANSGPNTNGSQFFITYAPVPWLNGAHTIFGQVVEGMDVVDSLTLRDPQGNPDYRGDALITVEITEAEGSALPEPTATPVPVVAVPDSSRPLADLDPVLREGLYTGVPEMIIDLNKTYEASIATSKGTFNVKLEPLSAPQSVNNFVVLSELGYYDGFPISAVQEGAFVLTGSPNARPDSDVGYAIPSEVGSPSTKGALGYWFRPDVLASSGSQIFFLLDDIPGWETDFTVFGYVTSGEHVLESLTLDDEIVKITIVER